MVKKIAIWASGRGSNALKIIEHIKPVEDMEVALVVTNRSGAGVRDIARQYEIPELVWTRQQLKDGAATREMLDDYGIDFIVLAGWLTLIPAHLIERYPQRILNIHPALLPQYGGKGMYGHHVHEAVKAAGDTESGITIHYVNEHYDEGGIVLQARTPIDPSDRPADIARKVLSLEHQYYPIVVEEVVRYG